jgi:hypothetical protein
MAALLGLLSFVLAVLLGLMVALYLQAKGDLQALQQDLARYKGIADLEKYKADIESKLRHARLYLPKFQTLAEMEQHKAKLEKSLAELTQANAEWQQRVSALAAQAEAVEETLEMQSFGFYRPKYDFADSQHYAYQLEKIREQQKQMVKLDQATQCAQQWTVDGSVAEGNKMVKQQAKLMLRAFNGECDAAIGKVKYDNVNNLEARINRSFEAINKQGESKRLWITREYLNLKLQELYLVHEHREKVHAEREEQRHIKAQMREEEKALKEIEKAKKEAEAEETSKTKALEKARQELAESQGKQTERLKAIVDKLEKELKDALERKAKAIARAQLTRSGHVYVLSNVGAFGEGVYKIGMTRRLEPLERVKELGDASVPFPYDVHAMIYSEDAPALERALHEHFSSRRLNFANMRREFFRTTLDEIREAVVKHFGAVTFRTVPEAEEYRRSLAIREELTRRGNNEDVLSVVQGNQGGNTVEGM